MSQDHPLPSSHLLLPSKSAPPHKSVRPGTATTDTGAEKPPTPGGRRCCISGACPAHIGWVLGPAVPRRVPLPNTVGDDARGGKGRAGGRGGFPVSLRGHAEAPRAKTQQNPCFFWPAALIVGTEGCVNLDQIGLTQIGSDHGWIAAPIDPPPARTLSPARRPTSST